MRKRSRRDAVSGYRNLTRQFRRELMVARTFLRTYKTVLNGLHEQAREYRNTGLWRKGAHRKFIPWRQTVGFSGGRPLKAM